MSSTATAQGNNDRSSLAPAGLRRQQADRVSLWVLLAVTAAVVALSIPVIMQGAPLADDYNACMTVREEGLGAAFAGQWELRGAVRPVHYGEIAAIGALCHSVHFGILITAGLALTIGVAYVLRALLRDLGVGAAPASLAGAVWLLQPLGTEAALWPSALHVPLGLLLVLLGLRALHAGRIWFGLALGFAACLSLEQLLFPLPLLTGLVVAPGDRRRATVMAVVIVLALVGIYAAYPGSTDRATVGLGDRLLNLTRDLDFYVRFPAIGLGAQSVPGALRWSFPIGVFVVLAGGVAGAWLGPTVLARDGHHGVSRRRALTVAGYLLAVAVLMNLPSLSYAPRDDSPRIFTPTWLLLAVAMGLAVWHHRWQRPRPVAAVAGMLAGAWLLSFAFSVDTRVESARVSADALTVLAQQVAEDGTVVVCEVPAKVVSPAPAGAFSLHDLFYDWAARPALAYHTGRHATVVVEYGACPTPASDVVPFDELVGGPMGEEP